MEHFLKIKRQYFDSILSNEKTFEIRKNDRSYNVGDKLILNETDENDFQTGRQLIVKITYIINGPIYGLESGFCILSIKRCGKQSRSNTSNKPSNISEVLEYASKITKIRKSKKGANYNYSVSRESAGMDDFVPPKKLSFNVPVFAGFENEAIFTFDFDFDYKEDDGQVKLFFKIENLNLKEILLSERKRIIKKHLSFIEKSKILWGSRKKYLGTDEWSFRNCEKE